MVEDSGVKDICKAVEARVKELQTKIEDWWFDQSLFSHGQKLRTKLKIFYAYVQVYHHQNFRRSDGEIEKNIKALIDMLENSESYRDCDEDNRQLMELVLGTAYRRLAQFRIERYLDADQEHRKADYYLEKNAAFIDNIDWTASAWAEADDPQKENYVITLLFLLNKAKYFRDIAEKDALRVDSSYWRALMLFHGITEKVMESSGMHVNIPMDGVMARIYVSAKLNIVRVYRQQQDYDKAQKECRKLINFCISSIRSEGDREEIREIVKRIPEFQGKKEQSDDETAVQPGAQPTAGGMCGDGSVCGLKYVRNQKDGVDYLFEDYILQALLQLGITNRDRVVFNGSVNGKSLIKQAMKVFLVLGVVDHVKDRGTLDSGSEEVQKSCKNQIIQCIDSLDEMGFDSSRKRAKGQEKYDRFAEEVVRLCTSTTEGAKGNILKNDDAKNNLAVCLKKLEYYDEAEKILADASLQDNRFAEYNRCKCMLDSKLPISVQKIREYCNKKPQEDKGRQESAEAQEDNGQQEGTKAQGDKGQQEGAKAQEEQKTVYIYTDDLEHTNSKWRFLYARYLLATGKYEEAEQEFHDISGMRAIRWNSLELKAAYLEAQCMLRNKQYLRAIGILTNILDALKKLGDEKSKGQGRHEIRTEIDLGWCFMMEDRYQDALDVYIKLLGYLLDQDEKMQVKELLQILRSEVAKESGPVSEQELSISWYKVDDKHQMMILHNIYGCLSYMQMRNQGNMLGEDDAEKLISEICRQRESQDIEIDFLSGLKELNLMKRKSDSDQKGEEARKSWGELSDKFGRVLKERPQDIIVYSCWAICKVNHCLNIPKSDDKIFPKEKERLLEGLVSSTTPITMKCYIEVSKLIVGEQAESFLDIVQDQGKTCDTELERSFLELFCHVQLLENGTNQVFMQLMENREFQSIEIITRARLLAEIVYLYGYILQIKNQFRVTYGDLKSIRTKYYGTKSADEQSIICQYTKLQTIKCLLLEKDAVEGKKGKEPKLRMSNVARMNDACEGVVFREVFKSIAEKEGKQEYLEIAQGYIDNSFGFKGDAKFSSYDSDVYLASFSMNANNFGLWSNYAENEKGCIIGFDESFFDFVDDSYYFIFDDEAEENTLYSVKYVDDTNQKQLKFPESDDKNWSVVKESILHILSGIVQIEKKLPDRNQGTGAEKAGGSISEKAAGEIRAFIADRINEIRFLFKSQSYGYEEELRMIRCSRTPQIDENGDSPVPRLYIDVEKKLENLTLILGSKVEQEQFKELSVWAKNTGKVKEVIWSDLNRPK